MTHHMQYLNLGTEEALVVTLGTEHISFAIPSIIHDSALVESRMHWQLAGPSDVKFSVFITRH